MPRLTIKALTEARIISAKRIEHARSKLTVTNLIICARLIISASSMIQKLSDVWLQLARWSACRLRVGWGWKGQTRWGSEIDRIPQCRIYVRNLCTSFCHRCQSGNRKPSNVPTNPCEVPVGRNRLPSSFHARPAPPNRNSQRYPTAQPCPPPIAT